MRIYYSVRIPKLYKNINKHIDIYFVGMRFRIALGRRLDKNNIFINRNYKETLLI